MKNSVLTKQVFFLPAHWFFRLGLTGLFFYHGFSQMPEMGFSGQFASTPVSILIILLLMEATGAVLVVAGGFFRGLLTRLGAVLLIITVLASFAFSPLGFFIMEGTGFRVAVLFILLYLLLREKKINESIFFSF
jgi:uncharacterized membrane protein YphA (DoxX/SURF4 family)